MQIILQQNVPNLGKRGEVKKVKDGYFRNYLLPNGLALFATPGRLREAEKRIEKMSADRQQIKENAAKYAKTLEKTTVKFTKKASKKGKLYGSIGKAELIAALEREAKIQLSEDMLELTEPLKQTGEFEVIAKLSNETRTTFKVEITGE